MTKQAVEVHKLTLKHNYLHKMRWRTVQVPLPAAPQRAPGQALAGLDGIEGEMVAEQHALAQPKPRKFELTPKS